MISHSLLSTHRSVLLSDFIRVLSLLWTVVDVENYKWATVLEEVPSASAWSVHVLHLLSLLSSPKAQGTLQKRRQKNCKSQSTGKTRAKVSFGHDKSTALLSSQPLWLPSTNVYRSSQWTPHPSIEWGGTYEPQLLLEELLTGEGF